MGETKLSRRTFVQALGALGVLSVAGVGVGCQAETASKQGTAGFSTPTKGKPVEAAVDPQTGEVTINEDVIIRYSGCVGCYSSCGNRIKLDRASGQMIGVGGNPYNPAGALPKLDFEAPLTDAYKTMSYANGAGTLGTICGRGNAMFNAVSQPGRITTPLKRAGKRGEGKWKPISWDELITEITEGGQLFAELGEDQHVEGFKEVHDPLTPMNPEQPDLGPKSNQIVIWNTRADGRRQLNARFASTFGTLNSF